MVSPLFLLVTLLSTFYLMYNKRYRWFYIIYKTLGRDIRIVSRFVQIRLAQLRHERNKETVPKIFTKIALKNPNKVAFYFENEVWTFEEVEKFSNRVAHFFENQGYVRGDTVALLLDSRPEYVCIWLGLSKIGVVTALINNNLVTDPLLHSIKVSGAKGVIYGADYAQAIQEISDKLPHIKLYQLSNKISKKEFISGAIDLRTELENQSDSSPVESLENGSPNDKLLFIYTSGTTGLPKAAVITNIRYMFMTWSIHLLIDMTEDDVIYDPLPLYHSAGGITGVGQCLLKGCTVAIRNKFSASLFWIDCVKYRCTVAQYIGEICRYLLVAHRNIDKPINHSVKKMYGNGLKPQIWKEFISKFGVKQMYEVYGTTEGNANFVNIDNTVGAVGFFPKWATFIYPVSLIKCDETGELIRNSDGFCQPCQPEEPGIMVGKIDPKKALNDFSGYADGKETEKKIIKNVFKDGDQYFNSGDILVQDEFGYFYFKDRTGDTFRWKGENVSTSEIEVLTSKLLNLIDVVVYGVEIPATEGRAGMLAIVDKTNNLDMQKLCKVLKNNLPSYAIPLFVRVMESLPMTGTYKPKKKDLQEEGFNLEKIKDRLFFYDSKNVTYVKLTKEMYKDIVSGKIRL